MSLRHRLGLLAVVAVTLAGCGGSGVEVRAFSEVQASPFVFEVDPAVADRGIFRVTTTEPMICAIVWGETEALGRFNNSLAMNGTGIVQHDVFLPGARSGVTYHYRVQGSTADGTLYQSDLGTFTLPERSTAPTTAVPGVNLALRATVVDVSSEFNAAFAATNAFDGDLSTEWSSRGDGDAAFVTIDLGAMRDLIGAQFLTRTMADGSATTTSFTVTVDDGAALGPYPAGTPADPVLASFTARGRVVRFDVVDSTGGNTGAAEIRLLGP